MIYRLKSGSPIETEAVVNFEAVEDKDAAGFEQLLGELGLRLEFGEILGNGDPEFAAVSLTGQIDSRTVIYGLGEANRGMNKKGFKYVSFNTDDPNHTENKSSLYGAHNFIIVRDGSNGVSFGLFIDCPTAVTFDLGFTSASLMRIYSECEDMYIYLISGSSMKDICMQFRQAIGRSYIAPLWSFGFQQSRWSYLNADEVRDIVNSYRASGIPLDAVYLDIDYMKDYKDFTIDEERFQDFAAFVTEMEEQGIHLVPIIDAGVKIENGYDVYEEGKSKGYFCSNEDASLFTAGVWPGWTHFPDFLRPEVREWFGKLYSRLTDYGIDGFWNDMNEPAMFYSEQNVNATVKLIKELSKQDEEISVDDCYRLKNSLAAWTSPEQYTYFYHNIGGKRIRHDKVHNLYGYNMTRAAAEALKELLPDKRPLLFSRSSYIGMHRYAGIWTGDNQSWWSHLLLNISMLPGLNMCGFLYSGADTGGFGSDVSEDLLIRWNQLSIFTPLFRNHSAMGTRRQECFRFEDRKTFKEMLSLRYRMIPYLYSEYLKAVLRFEMYFRPLSFDFEDDPECLAVTDELLLGEGLLIAPVYTQNADGRDVYLPEDMLMVRFSSAYDFTKQMMTKGHHYIKYGLKEEVFFLRRGHVLVLGNAEVCTADFANYNDAGPRGTLTRDEFDIIFAPGDEETGYEMLAPGEDGGVSNMI